MFSLYTRYTVTMPQGTISDAGIRAIESYLRNLDLQSEAWKKLNPSMVIRWLPPLPSTWEWTWIVARGEYAGTMPKRVAKYFHKVHGINMPQAVIAALGQLAREHSSTLKKYTFEIVNHIDWDDGEFGDSGSCWWGDYSGSRIMWDRNNGLAIRFYDESGEGYARAWMMEVDIRLYTVMNGYGLTTLEITRIFAYFTKLTYKQIHLHNSRSSALWINNSSGYLVGKLEVISKFESWDLDLEGEAVYTCYSCGRDIDEHDDFIGADDNHYCQNCYYDTFSTCEHCGSTYYNDELIYVESSSCDVCDWCYEHNYERCDKCGEDYRNHRLTTVGENRYCITCLNDLNTEGQNIE